MQKLPQSRTENILIQESGKELLIYDLIINQAYLLNETSTIVYQSCENQISIEELKLNKLFTDEVIFYALDQLRNLKLIEGEKIRSNPGLNRREVIKKVGLSSMIALPMISTLIAPTAVNAQSSCNSGLEGGSPGTMTTASVDTAVQPFTDCYLIAAAKCLSCNFTQGSGGAAGGGSTIFNCTVVCA